MAGGLFAASHFVVEAARGKGQKQASRLPFVRDLRRADPSTRGATAPQRAQRVKFVVRSTAHQSFIRQNDK